MSYVINFVVRSEELKSEYNNFFKKPLTIVSEMRAKATNPADNLNYDPPDPSGQSQTNNGSVGATAHRRLNAVVFPEANNRHIGQRTFSRGQRKLQRGRGSGSYRNTRVETRTSSMTNSDRFEVRQPGGRRVAINIGGQNLNNLID